MCIAPARLRSLACACLLTVGTPASGQVAGLVLEAASARPLADALVTVQATSIRTWTDDLGRFELSEATGTNLVVVGARKGYYNAYVLADSPTEAAIILLEPVPQDDDAGYEFSEPDDCAECHPDQELEWVGSAMARAGTNTWVYDIYDGSGTPGGQGGFVYLRDSAYAHDNPASECSACHQPEAWVRRPFEALDAADDLSDEALHGISCDICHKVADVDESKPNYPGLYPGSLTLTRPSATSDQVQYGVLGDTSFDLQDESMRPSYQPQLTAAMCGACHQDKNDPDEDGDFEDDEGVISEPTYLEWLASPYADPRSPLYATCVDCHMPASGLSLVARGWYGYVAPLRDSETIRSHRIEGTTARYLENAISLEMRTEKADRSLEVEITLFNDQAGHHVPDGVTVRNMILLVEARRRDSGQLLEQTGGPVIDALGGVGDPAQGYYADLPGILFAKVNHDATGEGPPFFTDATGIQWDNRIPALGVDTSAYRFEMPAADVGVDVRARLIYRRAFRFLVDAKGWTQDGHGRPLADVQPPHFGHLMEEATWSSSPSTAVTESESDSESGPADLFLGQNYPNPFNPRTRISYEVPEAGRVVLGVYNLLGEPVRRLVDEHQAAGPHTLTWDGRDHSGRRLASGTYLYRLQAASGTQMRKMLLVR